MQRMQYDANNLMRSSTLADTTCRIHAINKSVHE